MDMIVFFNDTATTEIYTLSLHDALPICHGRAEHGPGTSGEAQAQPRLADRDRDRRGRRDRDRKSTRLNSSHANISYAVFCLKKNKNLSRLILHSLLHPLTPSLRISY